MASIDIQIFLSCVKIFSSSGRLHLPREFRAYYRNNRAQKKQACLWLVGALLGLTMRQKVVAAIEEKMHHVALDGRAG